MPRAHGVNGLILQERPCLDPRGFSNIQMDRSTGHETPGDTSIWGHPKSCTPRSRNLRHHVNELLTSCASSHVPLDSAISSVCSSSAVLEHRETMLTWPVDPPPVRPQRTRENARGRPPLRLLRMQSCDQSIPWFRGCVDGVGSSLLSGKARRDFTSATRRSLTKAASVTSHVVSQDGSAFTWMV